MNVLDLFCGAGGFSQGFIQKKFNILLGIEVIPNFAQTFKQNHNTKCIVDDICNVTIDQIKKKTKNKDIDVIIGGPPCQAFSQAGKRDPNDPRSNLFKEYLRIVNEVKPKIFVMENVVGILTVKNKKGNLVKDDIIKKFKKIGYNVTYQKLIASDYGVPQMRKRIIFVGTPINSPIEFKFPKPTHENNHIGVGTVLLKRKEVDEKYYHSQKMIDGFNKRKEANKKKGKGFGAQVLDLDKPSYTISSRYWKDGADALVKYSETKIRKLTELECARIQTFPDDYNFFGTKVQVYQQIGNAVPCLLAQHIAKSVKRYLKKVR
jgi:DNA (cytosine-5)-methyltransferase 1